MKENVALLCKGKIDFKKMRAAIDDIGYIGWVQIEGTVPKNLTMPEAYKPAFENGKAALLSCSRRSKTVPVLLQMKRGSVAHAKTGTVLLRRENHLRGEPF